MHTHIKQSKQRSNHWIGDSTVWLANLNLEGMSGAETDMCASDSELHLQTENGWSAKQHKTPNSHKEQDEYSGNQSPILENASRTLESIPYNGTIDALNDSESMRLQEMCDEQFERKHYSEREITYNLLLRKLVDEFMDRTVTFSHQPKSALSSLQSVLVRNFPEFGESFHRERICAYLKACRRNAKKKHGEPCVRISARYLSAGIATRVAEQIYEHEKENLSRELEYHRLLMNQTKDTSVVNSNTQYISSNQVPIIVNPVPLACKPCNRMAPDTNSLTAKSLRPQIRSTGDELITQSPGIIELTIARLLSQTAEFLLIMADRLETGQCCFLDPASL
ncbi:hypothetical protein P879_07921 [Paragonimus westermani]|uniref:Nucleolar protein 4 helical domain-containing protein n=1 Tax=Paragonimus westermani TaxID=34504 RepID=A0A8T0DCQ5_9TREM|nr:hypothetical protein P879_07921 [Paragonimus westermani]